MAQRKHILSSTTILSALISLLIQVSESVFPVLLGEKELTSEELVSLVSAVGTSTIVIVGRFNAKQPLYTNKFLPGPNKEDLSEAIELLPSFEPNQTHSENIDSIKEEVDSIKNTANNVSQEFTQLIEANKKPDLHVVSSTDSSEELGYTDRQENKKGIINV